MFLMNLKIICIKLEIYRQFYYIEEIVWNCMFIFRYNRVNKLGKKFLYKFDLEIEQIKVLN